MALNKTLTSLRSTFRRLGVLIRRYDHDDVSSLAAQLTYYLILAFFPFLIFLLTLISYTPLSSQLILQELKPLLAHEFYQIVAEYIDGFFTEKQVTLLSLSILGTIWTSSSGVMALMKGLNKAYEIEDKRPYWQVKGISLLFTIGLGSVILLSLTLLVFGDFIGRLRTTYLPQSHSLSILWHLIRFGIPILIMFLVFVWIYSVVPNRTLLLRQVIPGAIYATVGWVVSSIVFAYYVNIWDSFNSYGSIGGAMLLLVWMYIISNHILIGGQINALILREQMFIRTEKVMHEKA